MAQWSGTRLEGATVRHLTMMDASFPPQFIYITAKHLHRCKDQTSIAIEDKRFDRKNQEFNPS
mgnify:CR=1 FL=1